MQEVGVKIVFACAIFGILCLGHLSVVSRSSVGQSGRHSHRYKQKQSRSPVFVYIANYAISVGDKSSPSHFCLQQFLDLVVDVLSGEAEFLVEDLVRGGETEGVETPDSTVFAHEGFESAR